MESDHSDNEEIDVNTLDTQDEYQNKRVYYAIQAVAADPVDNDDIRLGTKLKLQGLQSIDIQTDLDNEPVKQFGSLALYGEVPTEQSIKISLSKIIDNKPPLYLMLTQGTTADSSGKNIYELGNRKTDIYFGIWKDTSNFASGVSIETLYCSGMSITNIEYKFSIDDFTENIELEGHHRTWDIPPLPAQNPQDGEKIVTPELVCNDCIVPQSEYIKPDNVVVATRYSLDMENSIFPTGEGGIYGSLEDIRILSIDIQCSIDRQKIITLGKFSPYSNPIIYPTTVECVIETLMHPKELYDFHDFNGKRYIADLVQDPIYQPAQYDVKFPPDPENNWWKSGTKLLGPNGNKSFCTTEIPKHTFPKKILLKIKNCNDTSIKTQTDTDYISFDLGSQNRVQSIDYTNSNNGSNVIVRYTFRNYESFSVTHSKLSTAGRFNVNSMYN